MAEKLVFGDCLQAAGSHVTLTNIIHIAYNGSSKLDAQRQICYRNSRNHIADSPENYRNTPRAFTLEEGFK